MLSFVVAVEVFVEGLPLFVCVKRCFLLDSYFVFLALFLLNDFNIVVYEFLHLKFVHAVHNKSSL